MIKVCPTCQKNYPEDTEFCAQDGTRLEELQDDNEDPLLGRVLDGRWVMEKRIGEGGMGAVYLASQRSVDRKVAIKTLRPELCNSREFVDRFFREARVASNVAHPHCVTILDFGQTDDRTLYLAMEYLEGLPLTDRLRHPDLSVREILQICIQISSALAAAHQQNVIHRDLKPDNVFMLSISDGSTFVKVLDFGIAKVLDSEEKMTKTGQVFGTPEYMSPEQCRGDELDGRSDLYSLGCILYRMLGGKPPFESDTPMAVLVSHVSEAPPHVDEVIQRDDIPDGLSDLCMQLLSKDPDDRPADAQAVRARLEALMGHTTSGPTPAVDSASAAPNGQAQGSSESGGTAPTMAADSGALAGQSDEVAADGGAPSPQSPQPDSAPQPASDSQPSEARAETDDPSAPLRASVSGGRTDAAAAIAPKKKSSLPLILGVGIVVILAAGCTIGVAYAGYSYFLGGDEDVLALAGQETAEDDSEGAVADDGDETAELARVDDEPEDDNTDPAGDAPGDDNDDSAGTSDGAKPAGSGARDKGAASSSGGESEGSDDAPHKSPPDDDKPEDDDDPSGDGETAKIEINADKAEVAVHSNKSGGEAESGGEATSPSTSEDDREKTQEPEKKPGAIRQTQLSASGSACIQPNVAAVERRARPQFLSCYSDALSSSPDLSGKVMLAFNISTDGGVITPEVLVSEVNPVDACLLRKLEGLQFDPPNGGRCYVRLTYQLSP